MSSPVYSTQLIGAAGLGNTNIGYTVPAGYVCVLRDVDAFCHPTGSASAFVIAGNLSAVIWYWENASGFVGSGQWRGRQVFRPGQIITFEAQIGTYDFSASGYLLSLP